MTDMPHADDDNVLVKCQEEIVEVLKRHNCCAAFTIQRPESYLIGLHLVGPHSLLRDAGESHTLDAVTTKGLTEEEFKHRLGLTLSMVNALADGSDKNGELLHVMHTSLVEHLRSQGIRMSNRGPRWKPPTMQ